jgi:hypothetical protein
MGSGTIWKAPSIFWRLGGKSETGERALLLLRFEIFRPRLEFRIPHLMGLENIMGMRDIVQILKRKLRAFARIFRTY